MLNIKVNYNNSRYEKKRCIEIYIRPFKIFKAYNFERETQDKIPSYSEFPREKEVLWKTSCLKLPK